MSFNGRSKPKARILSRTFTLPGLEAAKTLSEGVISIIRYKKTPDSEKRIGSFITRRGAYLSSAILLPLYFSATCEAARRAIGTRNGEQET